MPDGITASLGTYINYRVQPERPADGPEISSESIERAMIEATKFYKPDPSKNEGDEEPHRPFHIACFFFIVCFEVRVAGAATI